jgi:hypothetical protein
LSSRQYTVTVKLKDDGILKKLEALGGGGSGPSVRVSNGVPSGPAVGGGADIFKKLEALGTSQLLKLTGIGVGIGSLVTAMTKSSGQLQSIFKLWETGMTLVFRPMADFIALTLRPITLALLSQFIIPFYRSVYPWFRDTGVKFGNWLAEQQNKTNQVADTQAKQLGEFGQNLQAFLNDSNNKAIQLRDKQVQEVSKAFSDFTDALKTNLVPIPDSILKIFTDLGDGIWSKLSQFPSIYLQLFTTIGDDLWKNLAQIPSVFLQIFTGMGSDLYNGLASIPNTFVDVFAGLAGNITTALATIPSKLYEAIMAIINSLNPFNGFGGGGGTTPSASPANTARTRTTMIGLADARSI